MDSSFREIYGVLGINEIHASMWAIDSMDAADSMDSVESANAMEPPKIHAFHGFHGSTKFMGLGSTESMGCMILLEPMESVYSVEFLQSLVFSHQQPWTPWN